jgi:hydroxymethylglutaryl-CoA lyase
MQAGVSIFHSSIAGLGGCPYAKGATGNVATEDVLYMLKGLGIETGIDFDATVKIGEYIARATGKTNASRVGKAIAAKMNGRST